MGVEEGSSSAVNSSSATILRLTTLFDRLDRFLGLSGLAFGMGYLCACEHNDAVDDDDNAMDGGEDVAISSKIQKKKDPKDKRKGCHVERSISRAAMMVVLVITWVMCGKNCWKEMQDTIAQKPPAAKANIESVKNLGNISGALAVVVEVLAPNIRFMEMDKKINVQGSSVMKRTERTGIHQTPSPWCEDPSPSMGLAGISLPSRASAAMNDSLSASEHPVIRSQAGGGELERAKPEPFSSRAAEPPLLDSMSYKEIKVSSVSSGNRNQKSFRLFSTIGSKIRRKRSGVSRSH